MGYDSIERIIDLYLKDVDLGMIEENLKLTPTERLEKLQKMQKAAAELRQATAIALKNE